MFLNEELERYAEKRIKTKILWQESLKVLAGGISHNIRDLNLPLIHAFPPFIKEAQGIVAKDIDNNSYTDYWCGHYALILGHKHPAIISALREHLERGWHFGTVLENQTKLGSQVIHDNPSIEKVRFCTSGTESTMYASRLARAFTKKRLIAKARMGWHGANDTLCYNVRYPFTGHESVGLLPAEEAGVLTFDIQYGKEHIEHLIKENPNDIAAIIIEPVLGGGGGFPVDIDLLKFLREITMENNILLIFDEVITGYRFGYGLYQNIINVIPDLTCMGKIVGGGMPIGIIGGRDEVMEMANPQSSNRVWIGGGTFSANPLSMIAGLKTLEELKKQKIEYSRINKLGTTLKERLNSFFQEKNLKFYATGFNSLITIHSLNRPLSDPLPLDLVNEANKKREALLNLALLNRGIMGMHGIGSLSLLHQKIQIEYLMEVITEISPVISSLDL